jgi:hypothetical protein
MKRIVLTVLALACFLEAVYARSPYSKLIDIDKEKIFPVEKYLHYDDEFTVLPYSVQGWKDTVDGYKSTSTGIDSFVIQKKSNGKYWLYSMNPFELGEDVVFEFSQKKDALKLAQTVFTLQYLAAYFMYDRFKDDEDFLQSLSSILDDGMMKKVREKNQNNSWLFKDMAYGYRIHGVGITGNTLGQLVMVYLFEDPLKRTRSTAELDRPEITKNKDGNYWPSGVCYKVKTSIWIVDEETSLAAMNGDYVVIWDYMNRFANHDNQKCFWFFPAFMFRYFEDDERIYYMGHRSEEFIPTYTGINPFRKDDNRESLSDAERFLVFYLW